MQPIVMSVGTIWRVRSSRQASQAPCTSFRNPYARMTLPKVRALLTWTLRGRCSCFARRSARPARMQASHAELRRISSTAMPISSTKAIVRSTSMGRELRWMLFSRMEHVMLVGCSLQAFISSIRTQTPSLLCRIVASMSSLKVTMLGAQLPPAVRMVSMTALARRSCPACRCCLMMVLWVTTSALPAATASSMIRSAAPVSPHSMQASIIAL
mmetsp:Transcript_117423/g.365690  ORF Transcript_117423/g.365690 Transcript_117423/m.365690 type:complete len:213 (-) Transcript_117423:276-914(-)